MCHELELTVGDLVVYASHGIGRVVVREARQVRGESCEVVVVECSRGLVVTLPLPHARTALRPLASEADVDAIRGALRASGSTAPDSWQKRIKATRAKLSGGRAVELAEVVRDADLRGRGLNARGGEPGGLSVNERQLYLRARELLAEELQASRAVAPAEADAWIETQLAHVQR